jgi:amidase
MPAADLCFLTACELAALIREKQLSAREVLEAHLAQIERVNPQVNAVVTLAAGQAREQARRADEAQARGDALGPLHGLPFASKDLIDTAGIRTTYGSPAFADHVPDRDAIHIERIRAAGAILIGKTNTPEFGAGSQTFNAVFGATHNPYDLTKTCGGSSGGSAAALACGMVPLADGTDHGGSLRNPAAFCNVVGFRVAPGRVPEASRLNAWSTFSVCGPMARTVSDVALLLSVMAGADRRSPISIHEPGELFRASLGRDFRRVHVAWFCGMGGIPFERAVLAAFQAQRRVFEDLGCIVEEAEPDWSGVHECYDVLRAWAFAYTYGDLVRARPELVKASIRWEVERGARLSGADIGAAVKRRTEVWERMRSFMETYEYFIAPTTQVLPFDVDREYPSEIEGAPMPTYTSWQKSCMLISCLENPAISVPCGFSAEGLPVGLQIVGRHRGECSVLQLAHAYECATGFARRRPAIADAGSEARRD